MDNKTLCKCGQTWGNHLIDPPHGLSPYAAALPPCARFEAAGMRRSKLTFRLPVLPEPSKGMRLALVGLVTAVVSAIVMWGAIAFTEAEPNVFAWTREARAFVAWMSLATAVIVAFLSTQENA